MTVCKYLHVYIYISMRISCVCLPICSGEGRQPRTFVRQKHCADCQQMACRPCLGSSPTDLRHLCPQAMPRQLANRFAQSAQTAPAIVCEHFADPQIANREQADPDLSHRPRCRSIGATPDSASIRSARV